MLRPLQDKVVVKKITVPLSSIIFVPGEQANEMGEVLAVGPGKKDARGNLMPMSVEVGQRVMYKDHGYPSAEFNGERHYVIAEGDIVGTVNG